MEQRFRAWRKVTQSYQANENATTHCATDCNLVRNAIVSKNSRRTSFAARMGVQTGICASNPR